MYSYTREGKDLTQLKTQLYNHSGSSATEVQLLKIHGGSETGCSTALRD